jgi:hypothetical protein
MNVVDSSGWIMCLIGGKNAHFFVPLIRDLARLLVPSICIYEVFKQLLVMADGEGNFDFASNFR